MEIRAFRGWRYRAAAGSDVGLYIAPPYDILSAQAKEALLAKSPSNIVAVDLPHVPPSEAGPDEEYAAAADRLRRWIATGVLCRDDKPSLYAYQQTFEWAGQTHCRRAMICSVRLSELGKDVIPHEHTFAGPKADRLKLMRHTRMQLSPIFGFYRDGEGLGMKLLWSTTAKRGPNVQGRLAGVEEQVWAVKDQHVIRDITLYLAREPVFIADGHHRYTTALNYRDELRAQGPLPDSHPANFVQFALVARDDPGLLVLPTHRVVRGLKADFSVAKLVTVATEFSWRKVPMDRMDFRDDRALRQLGPHALALLDAKAGELWVARLEDAQAMRDAAGDQPDAWRELDVAILHKLILEKALAPWRQGELQIEYTPDGQGALAACAVGKAQLGVLLTGTPIEAVEAVARAGAVMPHKSTYFYPKLATGMVLMPLE